MKHLRSGVIALILLLLAAGGWWAYKAYFKGGSRAIQATGTIEATSVDLTAKQAGTVQKLSIKEGDTVQQGQVVAELSRNDLLAQRDSVALAVQKAEDQLQDLVSGARAQEREQAAASLNMAEASYEKSSSDLARGQQLFDQGALAKGDLEKLQLAADLDKNKVDAARASLSLIDAGNRPMTIAAAQAEVERSKAVLQSSEAVVDDLQIVSPLAGVVQTKNFEQGEFVSMGAAVATVADLHDMWIRVYVPTDELTAVKLGQPVQFTVSGMTRVFTGTVSEIASKGEFTPKTIQTKEERANVVFGVKIRISNEGGLLKPGMPADVTF